jgi:RNA polymerase sigma factor (sigma-70 family)
MIARGPSLVIRRLRDWLGAHPGRDGEDVELLRRFITNRDEQAFEDLVRRHGPMVLGVCQRVLSSTEDIEDAFQATFLVLVRRAGTIRKTASLASWLHGVAHRVALESRRRGGRRRTHEQRAAIDEAATSLVDPAGAELRGVLDEELSRLPEKYRAPLVLHYLEGHTKEETARVLGWTEGTVSGRLARARGLLRGRLARRGLAVGGGTLLASLAEQTAGARVSAPLASAAVRLARLFLAGDAAAGAGSGHVLALTERVTHTMFLSKLKISAAVMLVVAVTGLGLAGLLYQAHADTRPDLPEPLQAAPEQPNAKGPDKAAEQKPGDPLLRVPLPERTMMTVTLSADGKRLAISPHDKTTVQLWDVATGKEQTLTGNPFSVTAMAFSPDGRMLATGTGSWLPDSAPGEIKLWEVATSKERATLGRLPEMVLALAFAPDGQTLASASKAVKLWNTATGKEVSEFRPSGGPCWSVAFAPDGKTLAVGVGVLEDKTPGTVVLYDLDTGRERATLPGHHGAVACVAFAPDGKTLASADSRGTLILWDVATAKERATSRPPDGVNGTFWLKALAFTGDSKKVLATMMLAFPAEERSGEALKEWDVADGKERTIFQATGAPSAKGFPLGLSGDAQVVGLARPALDPGLIGPDGKLELWEVRSLPGQPAKASAKAPAKAPARAKTKQEQEMERLEGTWLPIAYQSGKDVVKDDELKKYDWTQYKLIIANGTIRRQEQGQPGPVAKLVVDADKKPGTMDSVFTDPLFKGQVLRQLYRWQGELLEICSAFENGDVRPRQFGQPDTFTMTYRWEAR